ncbi:helix-turn-helix domain-containing protein [Tessaracoccus rhinocerotis]|uniref:Helix-turn-helix domain-containing protein n=1 Tax=Tessaracoccus rhinocerotis TaxID=1689449 RepID=A0A553K3P9_9ACTN|nr:helix-turn-helix domain-containing protein [Tessaracoccus rhinocerotis]TRY19347.1 helix-turn-helix domain-containing protein [Tessaracoccus rhinocerotis]
MTVDREIVHLNQEMSELVERMGSIQARLAALAYRRSSADGPQLLSISKAAAKIGVSPATMYRMVDAGQVDVIVAGSTRKVSTRWIEDYVAGVAKTGERQ